MSRERLALPGPLQAVQVLAHGAEAVRAAELERAFAAGRESGRAEAAAALDAAVERVAALERDSAGTLARTAAELALAIARRLLRREVARGNHDLEALVRETLAEAGVGRGPCVVHLNPADHDALAGVRFRAGTRLAADEGVPRGDVHVETPLGLLVRDLDAALEAIERRLFEELA